MFYKAVPAQDVISTVSMLSLYIMQDIPFFFNAM